MSFLTPLYLLGGLAITLPIVFHLIRRTPKGRQVFSSLMFLDASPPRMTKRNRIEDWLLLLLRSLAVCLLAIAFARPFLRAQDQLDQQADPGRRIAILVDTSASMQRDGAWNNAVRAVEKQIQKLEPADVVSLLSFDRHVQSVLSFSEWAAIAPESRPAAVSESLKALQPSFHATQLGQAMIQAADLLEDQADERAAERHLIVVSDFQTGSRWEALNGYQWPDSVHVQMVQVNDQLAATNAALQPVANESTTDDTIRLRVSNSEDADREQFTVRWIDEFSDPAVLSENETSVTVFVPPGQSKVIRAPQRPDHQISQRLLISGDDITFDNTCFVARRKPWQANILFIGAETRSGPESLSFFVQPVFPSTANRHVSVSIWNDESAQPPIAQESVTLVIVGGELTDVQLSWARNWVQQGGAMLFVATSAGQSQQLGGLLNVAQLDVREATLVDYAMLGEIDFQHPILAPFDSPRFADFTRLRFWKHRTFDPGNFENLRILARFDDGSPAIFECTAAGDVSNGEQSVSSGRVIVIAAGWNRIDSELAVWSKFVPLMNGLLEYLGERRISRPSFLVGEVITPRELGLLSPRTSMQRPDQDPQEVASDAAVELDMPGVYAVAESDAELATDRAVRFAVNLQPDESKTAVITDDILASVGIVLHKAEGPAARPEPRSEAETRQLMNRELESKQQLWKKVLAAALVVLILETALAGWRQRRRIVT